MEKLRTLLERRWAANAAALCVAAAFYLLLQNLGGIAGWFASVLHLLSPIFIGLVLAYLIDPVVQFFERRVFAGWKWKKLHTLCVFIAVILTLLLLSLFILAVVPALVHSGTGLINNMDGYVKATRTLYEQLSASDLGRMLNLASASELLDTVLETVTDSLRDNVGTILNKSVSLGSSLFNALIGIILAIYFLSGKADLLKGVRRLRSALLPPEKLEKHDAFLRDCHRIFIQYIGCNLLDGFVIGSANALFMAIARMPYAALVSVTVGVTNLLPTFGPIIGALIGGFVLVLVNPADALLFLIFTLVLQTVDGYFLKPLLFRGSFGIPAVWSLVSIIVGGKLFGAVGILLAIPTVAVLTGLYTRWLESRTGAGAEQASAHAQPLSTPPETETAPAALRVHSEKKEVKKA